MIDWRLPDIEGTELLIGKLNKTRPKMCKIMLTGYPSMNNAIAAVNNRADSFLLKPIDFEFLLAKIGELLKLQEQAVELTQDLVVNYIETRSKEMLSTATTERSS
ncbi:response regulator [Candidatus Bathyarchaeota archaeon]|nr:MAG: response regulator [Candidatus Bathyarchaeota archaeon]